MKKLIDNLLKIRHLLNSTTSSNIHERVEALEKRIKENKRKKNEVMYGSNMMENQSLSDLDRKGDVYNTMLSDQQTTSKIRQNARAMREGSQDQLVNREVTNSVVARETKEGAHSRKWQDSDPKHERWTRLPDPSQGIEGIAPTESLRQPRPGHNKDIQLEHNSNQVKDTRNLVWEKPRLSTSGISGANAEFANSDDFPLNVENYKKNKKSNIKTIFN